MAPLVARQPEPPFRWNTWPPSIRPSQHPLLLSVTPVSLCPSLSAGGFQECRSGKSKPTIIGDNGTRMRTCEKSREPSTVRKDTEAVKGLDIFSLSIEWVSVSTSDLYCRYTNSRSCPCDQRVRRHVYIWQRVKKRGHVVARRQKHNTQQCMCVCVCVWVAERTYVYAWMLQVSTDLPVSKCHRASKKITKPPPRHSQPVSGFNSVGADL